ncbi:MAG: aldehyde dehydrogenase family protein, partial [Hyphomonadaceae bacterium]
MSASLEFDLTIDGKGVPGAAQLDVINPATETLVARAPRASREQLDLAVAAARRAYPAWRALPIAERQKRVEALGAILA